jgi:hypothetical protein
MYTLFLSIYTLSLYIHTYSLYIRTLSLYTYAHSIYIYTLALSLSLSLSLSLALALQLSLMVSGGRPTRSGGCSGCTSPSRTPVLPPPSFRLQDSGFGLQGSVFMVQGSGFRVSPARGVARDVHDPLRRWYCPPLNLGELFSGNLLVRIHFTIDTIWWASLALWHF